MSWMDTLVPMDVRRSSSNSIVYPTLSQLYQCLLVILPVYLGNYRLYRTIEIYRFYFIEKSNSWPVGMVPGFMYAKIV